jgi:molecular chaperone GrpE
MNINQKVPRVSQPDEQQPDEAAVWKEKYARLFADLENTKKRLARSSAQEVEAEKEALLRDALPVADGLDLALKHTSREEDNRSILQGIEMVRNILNKFFIKYEVKAINAWGKPLTPGCTKPSVWFVIPSSLPTPW